jgi:hypothetical protein
MILESQSQSIASWIGKLGLLDIYNLFYSEVSLKHFMIKTACLSPTYLDACSSVETSPECLYHVPGRVKKRCRKERSLKWGVVA